MKPNQIGMFTVRGTALIALLSLAVTTALYAAEIKFVTEYRYPTAYEIVPMPGPIIQGINGVPLQNQAAGFMVIPKDFETREVGCILQVEAMISGFEFRVAMTDGFKLINNNNELMLAATSGDYSTASRLVTGGAPVNAQNRFGSTALMGASAGGFDKVVSVLLAGKADPNKKSSTGSTALGFAARNGHLPVVQSLIRNGADINSADAEGVTPLMEAINHDQTAIAKLLIEKGARADSHDNAGVSPLALAKARNNNDIVVLLTRADNNK